MESKPQKFPEDSLRERLVSDAYRPGPENGYNALSNKDYSLHGDDLVRNKKKEKICCLNNSWFFIILIIIVCLCILLITIGCIYSLIWLKNQKTANQICVSKECFETSEVMMSKMDSTLNPCDDFYQFACHKFISNPLHSNVSTKFNNFISVDKEVAKIIKELLEGKDSEIGNKHSQAISNSRKFYDSCLNLTYINYLGAKPMINLINMLGGWPILRVEPLNLNWQPSEFSLEKSLAAVHKLSMFPLINIYSHADLIDNTKHVLIISQGSLTFDDFTVYLDERKEKYKLAFSNLLASVLKLLGDEADKQTMIDDLWELETALAKAFDKAGHDENVDNIYNRMTADQAQKLFGTGFDVRMYLKELFGDEVNEQTVYVFTNIEYFKKMSTILEQAEPSTISNLLIWKVVKSLIEYLPDDFTTSYHDFQNRISETTSNKMRWQTCIEVTKEAFGFAISGLYIKNYFSVDEQAQVEEIFSSILKSLRDRLPRQNLMDDVTRQMAIKKLDRLSYQIGYPAFVLNATALDLYYEFKVTDSIFENVVSMLQHLFQKMKNCINQPTDKLAWDMFPISVDAYYAPNTNQIFYPAVMLRKPFYDYANPKSINFGVIGSFMAHELTHAFDTTGRKMDAYGNLADWWSNASSIIYKQKSDCFVDEYNNFKIQQHYLNGLLTLGENIADNGGLQITYEAYMRWLSSHQHQDLLLPGVNMSHEQQFFLGYAQAWCTYYNPSYEVNLLTTDSHSNSRFRVNGVLQNMEQFSSAFKCPPASNLNPANKCTLW